MSLAPALAWTPFCSSFKVEAKLFYNGPFYHELHIKNLQLDNIDLVFQV
jgi:hypothetical protein